MSPSMGSRPGSQTARLRGSRATWDWTPPRLVPAPQLWHAVARTSSAADPLQACVWDVRVRSRQLGITMYEACLHLNDGSSGIFQCCLQRSAWVHKATMLQPPEPEQPCTILALLLAAAMLSDRVQDRWPLSARRWLGKI